MTYQLLNVKVVVPLIIDYKSDESDDIHQTVAYVDYGQDLVFFPSNPELNTEEMRLVVLASLDSPLNIVVPEVPQDVLDQIEQVRSGSYESELGQGIMEFNRGDNGNE